MPAIAISPQRRDEILDALRRGTVPASSLDLLAVGLEPFEATLRAELDAVRAGRGMFKAVRGEYGSGKTFFARWFEELARREGFATSEVQISETETPLHRLEIVYRRLVEQSECRAHCSARRRFVYRRPQHGRSRRLRGQNRYYA
jgi:BREX system ATP-binding protein BrxC/D